ncbi:unnamed protein product [Rhizoctonia solani]|uniref:Uncharacterized protein n=1 Tax=Rhizoctonia solani TaxID=456999 RepID=A0A8H3DRF4_9AGAM|nr:unnamed protein product [Rhizoctonia solani]
MQATKQQSGSKVRSGGALPTLFCVPDYTILLVPTTPLRFLMSNFHLRTCICSDHVFNSQKSLSLHENSCLAIAKRDVARYVPYRSQYKKSHRMRGSVHSSKQVCLADTDLGSGPGVGECSTVARSTEEQASATAPNRIHAPPLDSATRPMTRAHTRRLCTTYREDCDALPEPPAPLPPIQNPPLSIQNPRRNLRPVPFITPTDTFGRYRVYQSRPLTIPDSDCVPEDFCDQPQSLEVLDQTGPEPRLNESIHDAIAPCPNISTYYFQDWFWNGSSKSKASREDLRQLMLRPDFNARDLDGVNLLALDQALAQATYEQSGSGVLKASDGWSARTVTVPIPLLGKGRVHSATTAPIEGLFSRSLLGGIRKGFMRNDIRNFVYEPYQSYYVPPGAPLSKPQMIMDEIYTSPAMLEAHKEVQRLNISDAKCALPRVVAAVMLGSDALQLGDFSKKKAWVLYMWLGNLSKYERCKPTSNSCYELAHLPSLPDHIKDRIAELNGRPASSALLAHLRRELMHAVLHELLDDEFLHAWRHGIIVKCADGITRRVFPRIFTYSADYPERVLLATIRDKGRCPCVRCLIPMDLIHKMGTRSDMQARTKHPRRDSLHRQKLVTRARSLIYKDHKAVGNTEVEGLLRPTSLVPTENAFSRRLFSLKFNFYNMFVVDLLHEIELGVWKSLLTHLIRILFGCGADVIAKFNHRFRQVPTFCNSTIRKFSDDVASLSRLAARDFEDILQCCIPVFKGLLPEPLDTQVQRLLFTFAYWHALAKLRQHTSTTLAKLSDVTKQLGDKMRALKESTADLEIFETPREFSSRQRRAAAKAQQSNLSEVVQVVRKRCELNLNTPKFHAIVHYVEIIRFFGTTDSYSTQTTELQHRKVKIQWERTNMKDAVPQMVRIGDIGDTLRGIKDRLDQLQSTKPSDDGVQLLQPNYIAIPNLAAYGIGQSERSEDAFNLPLWIHRNRQDFAVKFFIPLLKEHLLSRIPGMHQSSDLHKVTIQNDRLYSHATLQVNYTSYDVRRLQDTINPRSPYRFIVLPADTDAHAHPFLYAKVLGIYHANVRFDGRPARRMNFLWVRWLDYDEEAPGGWDVCRLDRVFYGKCRNDFELMNAFGFVAPHHIIRAAHLIPDFESGTTNPPGRTLVSDNEESDWKHHYVSRFVDRDMFMRYLGGGIGHFNRFPPSEGVEHPTYSIDDNEGEGLDINELQTAAEERIEFDNEDNSRGGNTAEVDPYADREGWWGEEYCDTDSNDAGSDDEPEDEADDGFIVDLYDF